MRATLIDLAFQITPIALISFAALVCFLKKMPVALAFLAAPLIPTLALLHDAGPLIATVYSYVLSYFFGIPGYFILKDSKRDSHMVYTLLGASSAPVVVILFLFIDSATGGTGRQSLVYMALILSAIGALEGLCFSLITRWRPGNTAVADV